jgi:hypothetical protein
MKASCQLLKSKSKSNQLKGGNGMKLKQALKITLLIVILAEEIKSVVKQMKRKLKPGFTPY